jgi:cytosine/adenosine deaminase-related metal-dependent hydrolase
MVVYKAAWVCPIARPPIRDGWVAINDRRIVGLGGASDAHPDGIVRNLGHAVIMPGLVNAHTHLELSWLRGRVPPAATFTDWIKQLFITRGGRRESPDDPKVVDAATQAAREAREFGTAAIGDISNSLASVPALRDTGLYGLVFHELLGFNLPHGRAVADTRQRRVAARALCGSTVRVSLAPHAPYSVSPEMFRAIRAEVDADEVRITSVHVGESVSEVQFLKDGSGPWSEILRWVGSTRDDWQPPGCDPVTYLESLGMLDARTLVVHGVQLTDANLARLAEIGCTVVTCPRSNQWVGAGVPPVARFYASGVKVAVGTDSLASVEDLNVFAELKTMRWLAPDVAPRQLLESATLTGAAALGLDHILGSIEPDKHAALIAVDVGHPTDQVEEYLLTGIDLRQVQWLA